MNREEIEQEVEAIKLFGEEVVCQVKETVDMCDPDAAYTAFEEVGLSEHAECVEFLYFS
jgi:hypothetical protein